MTAQPAFALTVENAAEVAQVCCRLEGIPLALELAAARLKALPLATLNERLDDMLGLLTGGRRTVLPRHQTLRALIDWSYDLLSAPEQALLRRLSVFAGGCTLTAAEAVCSGVQAFRRSGAQEQPLSERLNARMPERPDAVLDLLTRLVEKSMVVYEEREGEERYRLLEMIREYARERLAESGEREPLQERHAGFFLALAETAAPELAGPEECRWLVRLEREHDNLRAALAWSLEAAAGPLSAISKAEPTLTESREPKAESPLELGLRLGGALVEFWSLRGYHKEGQDQLLRLLAQTGAASPTAARARALHGAGLFCRFHGELESARRLHEESLAVRRSLGDRAAIAIALEDLGDVAHHQGDATAARALLAESLAIRRDRGDRCGIANSLNCLAWAALREGDLPAARALAEEGLAIRRELGEWAATAASLEMLGSVAYHQGDLTNARPPLEESLAIRRELADPRGIANALNTLAYVIRLEGDLPAARALAEESLALRRELGDRAGIAASLEMLGGVAYDQGDWATGRALLEESLAMRRERGDRRGIAMVRDRLAWVTREAPDLRTARG